MTEKERLASRSKGPADWSFWGPYISERQWGTVREDYSADGEAWDFFPHDHARSRTYRWGEDGIAGISDKEQRLCLSLALWNGKDAILKERLFGLNGEEGNHGEDVKELYYYLDNVPSHAYMKMLYKYPQAAFPYQALVEENHRRGRQDAEFEVLDTGVFDADRYFDVQVEYAKASETDLFMVVTAFNRGPEAADLCLMPQCWFRNTWLADPEALKPRLSVEGPGLLKAEHPLMGAYHLAFEGPLQALFCDNESNAPKLWKQPGTARFFKDGLNDYLVEGRQEAVNPAQEGTRAGLLLRTRIEAGGSVRLRLRLSAAAVPQPFADADTVLAARAAEADAFYQDLQKDLADPDARLVQRQALAGLLWSKQYYGYDVRQWLQGDPGRPAPPASRWQGRNHDWQHLQFSAVLSMPDKWEYPWFAAWDLAFHCVALSVVDPAFAKQQLLLLTRDWAMHPNGQLPAYEWALGDVNPPVQAWAAWRIYQMDSHSQGESDRVFLQRLFHKLLLNFNWWVNRKDSEGRNLFQGGFLGLDNIGAFNRSAALPEGGTLEQSDGTAWMALYCLNMMRIALELSRREPVYEDLATKFLEHFLYIADAMTNAGGDDLWDEADEFFYDRLRLPNGDLETLRVRSMVGLVPLFAVETLDPELLKGVPEFMHRLQWFLKHRPDLAQLVARWDQPGKDQRMLLGLLKPERLQSLLKRMVDPAEFWSGHGVRALSKAHLAQPYTLELDGANFSVNYEPGESESGLFGGNSNWRGPVWMPMNYLLVEALQRLHSYYGDSFKVALPFEGGQAVDLGQLAQRLSGQLAGLFLKDTQGQRPCFGADSRQASPYFKDLLLFHEYFHGDTGRGLGASHQTGWTALVAKLLQPPIKAEAPHA